jgi:anionic cell wall polymer biosynthesis LytR-Cps2A-Psr (LCP) family protein
MNGKTALKYVRSRHGDNNEGTDFARSKRQQNVISAIKNKAMSTKTLLNPVKLKELYDAYAKNVDTNVTMSNVQSFYLLSQQVDFNKIISVVLDDRSEAVEGGLLYAPEDNTLYGGQYVLIPKIEDYSQIHAYVQKYLFGDK